MMVVSGCESGKGEIQEGEGVYGLKRSFAVAGARSSLLSLWKVDDAATALFYGELLSTPYESAKIDYFYRRIRAEFLSVFNPS